MTCPEGEQNQEPPYKERFDPDAAESGPLPLDGDTDAEGESEQVEGFELHQYPRQQVNRMVYHSGVRVEVKNVIEQGDAEEVEQVDQQNPEKCKTA